MFEAAESVIFRTKFKHVVMSTKRVFTALLVVLIVTGVSAQKKEYKVKVFDLQDQTTILTKVSSSSSSSCESSDFPVYQGSTKTDIDFADLKSVIVRHDQPAEDPNNYITVELEFLNGKTGFYEMVKQIRIVGTSEAGSFSKKIIEVNMIEVLHKPY